MPSVSDRNARGPDGSVRDPEALVCGTYALERILRSAERTYPREACGFLLGSRDDRRLSVQRVIDAENRARRDDRFLIDAADVFAAMREARKAGIELLGVYHSHPDGSARPSATDRRDAAETWAWVVVACAGGRAGEIGCWWWTGEDFSSLSLLLREPTGSSSPGAEPGAPPR